MFGRMNAQVCKRVNIFIVVKKAAAAAAAAAGCKGGSREAAALLPPSFVAPYNIMRRVRAMMQKMVAVGDPGGPMGMPLGMPKQPLQMMNLAGALGFGGNGGRGRS